MKNCNLLLHCGGQAVDRLEVSRVPTPRPTATWTPVPHLAFIEEIERALTATRLEVVKQAHALSHEGMRYFGLMQLAARTRGGESALVVGLRNSHDKRFPAGLSAGAQVFVCDNLAFSGEVTLARRHTRNILQDLPMLALRAMGGLLEMWDRHGLRVERYREVRMQDVEVHDVLVRAVDVGVCPVSVLPKVLDHWRHPPHAEFRERNAWSVFNSFTEVLKGNLPALPARTRALHALLDAHVGLEARN